MSPSPERALAGSRRVLRVWSAALVVTAVAASQADRARAQTALDAPAAVYSDVPPEAMAPSRIGQTPTFGRSTVSSAGSTGYDSLNRRRRARKAYPGEPKPIGPLQGLSATPTTLPPPLTFGPPRFNLAPLAPSLAGTVQGQPTRRRLKPDLDPFGPVGDYVGSFLVKTAVEVSGGYDTNPGRFTHPQGSSFYVIAPELLVASDWSRHSVIADLRGSFTGFGKTFPDCDCGPGGTGISPVPVIIDRPDFTGRISGRLDVTRDTRILSEARLRVSTDNPGSPNIQAGLQRYPLYAGFGGTLGVEQAFNRLTITANATVDRVEYQNSVLTNGVSTPNTDRNFDQYGGLLRASYELLPGLRPFVEIGGDTRRHDSFADRFGYERDSVSSYAKAGSTFELTRLITGEASVGYGSRDYRDPRLANLDGLLTSASLIYAVTPLTTVKFTSNTSLDETTLPGASGVLVRTYTAEVSHDFRRWLTGIGRFTYGTLDYQGGNRLDEFYSASVDVIYRLNRTWQIKGQLRHDVLQSSIPGFSTASTAAMLGVRWQN